MRFFSLFIYCSVLIAILCTSTLHAYENYSPFRLSNKTSGYIHSFSQDSAVTSYHGSILGVNHQMAWNDTERISLFYERKYAIVDSEDTNQDNMIFQYYGTLEPNYKVFGGLNHFLLQLYYQQGDVVFGGISQPLNSNSDASCKAAISLYNAPYPIQAIQVSPGYGYRMNPFDLGNAYLYTDLSIISTWGANPLGGKFFFSIGHHTRWEIEGFVLNGRLLFGAETYGVHNDGVQVFNSEDLLNGIIGVDVEFPLLSENTFKIGYSRLSYNSGTPTERSVVQYTIMLQMKY